MKRLPTWLLIVTVCLLFLAFAAGYYLGQDRSAGELRVTMTKREATDAQRLRGAEEAETEEVAALPSSRAQEEAPKAVNLNTATLEELDALPNIGTTLARRILAYREEKGKFLAVEELLEVEGIGESTLEALRDYVTVEETE